MIALVLECEKITAEPTGSTLKIISDISKCKCDYKDWFDMEVNFTLGKKWRFFTSLPRAEDKQLTFIVKCDVYDVECSSMMKSLPSSEVDIVITLWEYVTGFHVSQVGHIPEDKLFSQPTLWLTLFGCFVVVVIVAGITITVYLKRRHTSKEHADEITRIVSDMRDFLDEPIAH